MTLHKAIEAARYYLERIKLNDTSEGDYSEMWATNALSTLTAKPMSEEEILATICKASNLQSPKLKYETDYWLFAIRAIRDAGVLYVEDK